MSNLQVLGVGETRRPPMPTAFKILFLVVVVLMIVSYFSSCRGNWNYQPEATASDLIQKLPSVELSALGD